MERRCPVQDAEIPRQNLSSRGKPAPDQFPTKTAFRPATLVERGTGLALAPSSTLWLATVEDHQHISRDSFNTMIPI